MARYGFTTRFLHLTFVGYLVAIVTVAGAVWIASAPTLEQMQRDAKQVHLATKANVISGVLDDVVDEGEYLAIDPDVVAFVLGEAGRETRASDRFSQMEGARNLRLFDYRGRLIYEHSQSMVRSPFLTIEGVDGLSDLVDGRKEADARVSYRPGEEPFEALFQISTPIVSRGLVEGLLVYEVKIDLTAVLQGNKSNPSTILLTPFQKDKWAEWTGGEDIVSVQMPGGTFFLAADTNREALTTMGNHLVLKAISVALVALILPFSFMSISGMRAIVRPHKDLQASQVLLAQKQGELEELAQIAEMANESIIVTDRNEKIIWVNKAFTEMTGFKQQEAVGRTPRKILQGDDTEIETRQAIRQALSNRQPIQKEILNYHKNGCAYWVNLSISPLVSRRTGELRFTSIATDVTAAKQAQLSIAQAKSQTEHQARHDPLTGLPNRRFLDEILENAVSNDDPSRTIIRIDLDHFKNVNDTLGHAAGDYVLCEVAEILQKHIDEEDFASRVGGDEFVILLGQERNPGHAMDLTEEILHEIRKDMSFEDKTCRIGASFGVATALEKFVTNEDLLKSADAALYLAKDTGRNTTKFYTPELHRAVLEKRRLSSELEDGLARDEFEAFFQPQFDANTEQLAGVEALVRWRHPTRGILPPSEFLQVAEQLRLLGDIDRRVFAYGFDCIKSLGEIGLHIPKISFNVGIQQLVSPEIEYLAGQDRIGDTRVSLEVLESVLVEEQGSGFLDRIAQLREMGFTIEVDDFGSGHASVVGLQTLNPDIMKLDRLLVAPIVQSPTARNLIKSMVEIGKVLGISVTAEGIETVEHAAIMRDLGCDTFQGFYFSRPMDFEQLKIFARNGYDENLGRVTSFAVHKDRKNEV